MRGIGAQEACQSQTRKGATRLGLLGSTGRCGRAADAFLEFDWPLDDPDHIDAVVLGCYKPTGRYASRTHVKCSVKIGARELDLWSRETRPASSHATVLQFRRRYSGLTFYQLADSVKE